MESEAFEAYREIPFAGQGRSLEEAFHRFCEAEGIGAPEEREDEFLAAMMKALLLSPDPDFALPPDVLASAGGFFAVGRRGAPKLYAAVSGRLVTGALTPFLAELLLSEDAPAAVAVRHGVSPAIRDAALAELGALGLLAWPSPKGSLPSPCSLRRAAPRPRRGLRRRPPPVAGGPMASPTALPGASASGRRGWGPRPRTARGSLRSARSGSGSRRAI
jgi:hypothetical protein